MNNEEIFSYKGKEIRSPALSFLREYLISAENNPIIVKKIEMGLLSEEDKEIANLIWNISIKEEKDKYFIYF